MPDIHFEDSWETLKKDYAPYNEQREDVQNGAITRTTKDVAKAILSFARMNARQRTTEAKEAGLSKHLTCSDLLVIRTNNKAIKAYVSEKVDKKRCHANTVREAIIALIDFGFIVRKVNHGPRRNYELHLNPKYIVFVVDPKTYNFAADSVAELTLC